MSLELLTNGYGLVIYIHDMLDSENCVITQNVNFYKVLL